MKNLADALSESELEVAMACARTKVFRDAIRTIGKIVQYDGNKESIVDAVKRVVEERDSLRVQLDNKKAEIVQLEGELNEKI